MPPFDETIRLFAGWRDEFDRFPFVTSPAYHAIRQWFRWLPVPVSPGLHPPAPRYREYDRLEGRGEEGRGLDLTFDRLVLAAQWCRAGDLRGVQHALAQRNVRGGTSLPRVVTMSQADSSSSISVRGRAVIVQPVRIERPNED